MDSIQVIRESEYREFKCRTFIAAGRRENFEQNVRRIYHDCDWSSKVQQTALSNEMWAELSWDRE